jgi:FkbM family methyltransferase
MDFFFPLAWGSLLLTMTKSSSNPFHTSAETLRRNQIFHRFTCWEGVVPEGFIVDFLGVMTRTNYYQQYVKDSQEYPPGRYVKSEYPPLGEDYLEWADLLEAIIAANEYFTMVELGAGFGRWVTKAGAAIRFLGGPSYTCVAVEADPTHFKLIAQHLSDNALDPKNFRLIEAAVTSSDGKIGFHAGTNLWGGNVDYYSQSIGGPHVVDAVSLRALLAPFATVDLIDLDIQGAELDVLESAAQEIDQKVKRIHVGTHSVRIEEGLRSLFNRLGWGCLYDFAGSTSVETQEGMVRFQDGVQTWLNPTFSGGRANEVAILVQKLNAARSEGTRLWKELERVRGEQNQADLNKNSVAWKFIEWCRRFRDRIAPSGTGRRKILDFMSELIRGPVE